MATQLLAWTGHAPLVAERRRTRGVGEAIRWSRLPFCRTPRSAASSVRMDNRTIFGILRGPMHELAIAQSALQQVLREAERAGACRVTRIVLRIGALSGVETDSLRFAFDALLPASVAAAGASIDLELVPALARCRDCSHEFEPATGTLFECPRCRAFGAELRSGRELDLVRIDCS